MELNKQVQEFLVFDKLNDSAKKEINKGHSTRHKVNNPMTYLDEALEQKEKDATNKYFYDLMINKIYGLINAEIQKQGDLEMEQIEKDCICCYRQKLNDSITFLEKILEREVFKNLQDISHLPLVNFDYRCDGIWKIIQNKLQKISDQDNLSKNNEYLKIKTKALDDFAKDKSNIENTEFKNVRDEIVNKIKSEQSYLEQWANNFKDLDLQHKKANIIFPMAYYSGRDNITTTNPFEGLQQDDMGNWVDSKYMPNKVVLDECFNSPNITKQQVRKETEGIKHNQNKPQLSLLFKQFPKALEAIAKCSEYGHQKYKETDEDYLNFKRVEGGSKSYADAGLRHRMFTEKTTDIDSQLPHSFHICWNALAELELILENK